MEDVEQVSFQIIAFVGSARSKYIEAIKDAKQGDITKAKDKIKEGDEFFTQGHHAHLSLITEEANGNQTTVSLLLAHAEDQLMSAETIKIMAESFIDLYEEKHSN